MNGRYEGRIVRRETDGFYVVQPNSGSEAILINSQRMGIPIGQEIRYSDIRDGWAHRWEMTNGSPQQAQIQPTPTTNLPIEARIAEDVSAAPNQKTKRSIREILAATDMFGISALIIYDSSPEVWTYHFIAIAATRERAHNAIETIYRWGFGGGGSTGISHYHGRNGLFGDRQHVVRDFRQKVADAQKQDGILFVPFSGLTIDGEFIPDNVLEECVESARLDLEARTKT